MDQNTIQSEIGGCPKSDHAKMHVFIGIYSVFRGSVDHGGRVSIYIYIYIYIYISLRVCVSKAPNYWALEPYALNP